jgi:hypothetical protein
MQDRPTARELLEAVRAFLTDELVPRLEGRRRFHTLVAANVLAIVARELDRDEPGLTLEWRSLTTLLGLESGPLPAGLGALRARVGELTALLAERIRQGEADAGPFATAVRAHVRATVREKLAVANPTALHP